MVDLGCHDTDWEGGNNKDVLEAILWRDGLILGTLSVDEGKCGYLGWIFGCLTTLREAPRVKGG